MEYPICLRMDFVGAPYLIKPPLRSIVMHVTFPFTMSMGIILVVINDIYSSELDHFDE